MQKLQKQKKNSKKQVICVFWVQAGVEALIYILSAYYCLYL